MGRIKRGPCGSHTQETESHKQCAIYKGHTVRVVNTQYLSGTNMRTNTGHENVKIGFQYAVTLSRASCPLSYTVLLQRALFACFCCELVFLLPLTPVSLPVGHLALLLLSGWSPVDLSIYLLVSPLWIHPVTLPTALCACCGALRLFGNCALRFLLLFSNCALHLLLLLG